MSLRTRFWAILLAAALSPAAALAQDTPIPDLVPCSPQAAAGWQNNAFRKALGSSKAIGSTHGLIAENNGANGDLSDTYQNQWNTRRNNRRSDFRDPDACWGRAADEIGRSIDGLIRLIRGGFPRIFDLSRIAKLSSMDFGKLLCSATRRVDKAAAVGIYTVGRLPGILSDRAVNEVRWRTRRYENYGRWQQRRAQRLPDAVTRRKIRDWTHSSDLPIRAPWGYPDRTWPNSWNGRGG